MNIHDSTLLKDILTLSQHASEAILDISERKAYQIQSKNDQSPVTEADVRSHQIIKEGLAAIDPDTPMISEEGEDIPFLERKHWSRFWLVDPLDGTKEFIRNSNEFSVNIALIEDNEPILGVVAVPKLGHYYWSVKGSKAFFQDEKGIHPLHSRDSLQFPVRIAMSRDSSHGRSHELEWAKLLGKINKYEITYYGSALKICLIAADHIDLYPRFGSTGEWDTAAGQCILESAGGKIVNLKGERLKYNAGPTLLNPPFLAVGCVELLSYIVDKSI